MKGSIWSRGTGIYTNDLVLETDGNVSMAKYYLETVFDYGNLLKDMIKKQIPSSFGIKPNSVVLNSDNFKVVQINKHITDTDDAQELKDLHKNKNTIKTKVEQINDAITQKNKELSVKKYSSIAEKSRSQNELTKLVSEQEAYSRNLYSVTRQLKSKTDTISTIAPKFKLRGFWNIPDGQLQKGYKTQEVVQFRIQHRYSSKSGNENQTEGYNLVDGDTTTTAFFSNWVENLSSVRTRTYDEDTELWEWDTVDVADADVPNINQLNISINSGEKVEVRVIAISEVGLPDTPLESDWSNILTIEFPNDLNNVLSQNEYILAEAEQDNNAIEFEQSLSTKGITRHVQSSYFSSDEYTAHTDDEIVTGYKDDQGNSYNLKEYLDYLTNKIVSLENIVSAATGILKISVFNGTDEIEVKNNSEININLSLQNYGITTDDINYSNVVSIIKDYYIKFENLSIGALDFLVNDSYVSGTTVRAATVDKLTSLVDTQNDIVVQEDGQFIYFCDNYQNNNLYIGQVMHNSVDGDGVELLQSGITSTTRSVGISDSYINKNRSGNESNLAYPMTGYTDPMGYNEWISSGVADMGTTIAPQVNVIDDLFGTDNKYNMDNNEELVIPLNIYWVFKTDNVSSVMLSNEPLKEHNKSLKVRLHPSTLSSNTSFEFVINFNIKNKNI